MDCQLSQSKELTSLQQPPVAIEANVNEEQKEMDPPAYMTMVDPVLVEALQNPRHRLTSLFFSLFMLSSFNLD